MGTPGDPRRSGAPDLSAFVQDTGPERSELESRVRQQAAVAQLGLRALSDLDVRALADEILAVACCCLRTPMAAALEIQDGRTSPIAARGVRFPPDMRGGLRGTPGGLLLATRVPVLIEDIGTDERFSRSPILEAAGARSCAAVLVHWRSESLATLTVIDREPRCFSARDVDFLQSLANVLAAAMQRARQERSLRASEHRYRSLVETTREGVWTVDASGRVDYLNQAMAEMLGRAPDEILGRELVDFLVPEERARDEWRNPPHDLRATVEARLVRKDGAILRTRFSRSALRGESGEYRGAFAIVADVTERRGLEEALATGERFYRTLLSNASDLVAITDHEGAIKYVSPSIQKLLGWEPADLVGKSAFQLLHPEDLAVAKDTLANLLAIPASSGFYTVRYRRKDGQYRWIEAASRNLLTDEAVRGIVMNCRDVSERQEAEQALRQSEEKLRQSQKIEAVGRLAGGIAHDFNNLLTAILTTVQLALSELPHDHPVRGDLDDIRGAGEKAANLTRQLLAFSRRQVLRPRVLDLRAAVADMGKMLARLIGEDIRLVSEAADGCTVCADPGQIEQVILNLALNARDAMPRGGTLTLRTRTVELTQDDGVRMFGCSIARGRYVQLQVQDTGAGMDEHTLQRIFEPFFTTKELGKGTGLGLATVYGIVKQSGGYIRVTSAVGQGSTFEVYLPVSEGAPATSAHGAPQETPTGRGETVLLVEDEDAVRMAARKALSRGGFNVVEARNGEEALQRWRERSAVDLVVSDLIMPEMGGRELATRLREDAPRLKVLFMSGYTDDAGIRQGALAKGMGFLSKPFTPESLVRKAREMLDQAS
jgi:two-component system, cell cycle sensor histidine kinase and response regulator CckA